jgi:hypothetical protein
MGIIKKVRSIFPIPKDWENDEDRKQFSIRLDKMIRELFMGMRSFDETEKVEPTAKTTRITTNYSQAIRIGNTVIITISGSVTNTLATLSTLYTVPGKYRPRETEMAVFAYENNGTVTRYRPDFFRINKDGEISQTWSGSWGSGDFSVMFIYHV